MSIAYFDALEVPLVHSEVINREFIGDRVRLAGGKMHQDMAGDKPYKYTRRLETRPLKSSVGENLVSHLEDNNAKVEFNMDEMSSAVTSYVNIENEERIGFTARDGSGWQNDGKSFTFEIIEQ